MEKLGGGWILLKDLLRTPSIKRMNVDLDEALDYVTHAMAKALIEAQPSEIRLTVQYNQGQWYIKACQGHK